MLKQEQLIPKVNIFLYRISGGRLGSQLGRQSVLLLHTVGRKSGKPYTTPLPYYRDGQNYLVVASNWGKETDPDWLRNLRHQPRTTIQVKGQTFQVEARESEGEEYQRLWKLVTSRNDQYVKYKNTTKRLIPIVVLAPVETH